MLCSGIGTPDCRGAGQWDRPNRQQETLTSASSKAMTFSSSMFGSISTTNECPRSVTNVSCIASRCRVQGQGLSKTDSSSCERRPSSRIPDPGSSHREGLRLQCTLLGLATGYLRASSTAQSTSRKRRTDSADGSEHKRHGRECFQLTTATLYLEDSREERSPTRTQKDSRLQGQSQRRTVQHRLLSTTHRLGH